jgi:type VI secretion system protein ImpB
MAKSDTGSVAPKERINIVYRPATGGRKETVELPLKLMVMGDFMGRQDERPMEERDPLEVNKTNFDDVMGSMGLSAEISVPNTEGQPGDELSVKLEFNCIRDFDPGRVVQAVPELRTMLELREALKALKGPLGNVPAMRKTIQDIVQDEAKAKQLMAELGLK